MMMLRCQRSSETFKIGKFTKPRYTYKKSNGLQELQFVCSNKCFSILHHYIDHGRRHKAFILKHRNFLSLASQPFTFFGALISAESKLLRAKKSLVQRKATNSSLPASLSCCADMLVQDWQRPGPELSFSSDRLT